MFRFILLSFSFCREFASLFDDIVKEFEADLRSFELEKGEEKETEAMKLDEPGQAGNEKELLLPETAPPDLIGSDDDARNADDTERATEVMEVEGVGATKRPAKVDRTDEAVDDNVAEEAKEEEKQIAKTLKSTSKRRPPAAIGKAIESASDAARCLRLPAEVVANFLSDVEFTTEDVFYNIDACMWPSLLLCLCTTILFRFLVFVVVFFFSSMAD
jgi:hypothetical protein